MIYEFKGWDSRATWDLMNENATMHYEKKNSFHGYNQSWPIAQSSNVVHYGKSGNMN